MIRPFLILFFLLGSLLLADNQRADLIVASNGRTGKMNFYRFSSDEVALKIIPRGQFTNLESAMKAHQCLAGCNGGFFDPQQKPLGEVIANGKKSGRRNLASSLTSGVLYQDGKILAIERAKTFYQKNLTPSQLLQTGPFLVENGQPVKGLSTRRSARRTLIATDNGGNWLIAQTPPITLAQLAKSLSEADKSYGFEVKTALNLDGGSSSALWIDRGIGGNPFYLREFKSVANYIGLVAP